MVHLCTSAACTECPACPTGIYSDSSLANNYISRFRGARLTIQCVHQNAAGPVQVLSSCGPTIGGFTEAVSCNSIKMYGHETCTTLYLTVQSFGQTKGLGPGARNSDSVVGIHLDMFGTEWQIHFHYFFSVVARESTAFHTKQEIKDQRKESERFVFTPPPQFLPDHPEKHTCRITL